VAVLHEHPVVIFTADSRNRLPTPEYEIAANQNPYAKPRPISLCAMLPTSYTVNKENDTAKFVLKSPRAMCVESEASVLTVYVNCPTLWN